MYFLRVRGIAGDGPFEPVVTNLPFQIALSDHVCLYEKIPSRTYIPMISSGMVVHDDDEVIV